MTNSANPTFRVGTKVVHGVSDGLFTMREGFMNVPGYHERFADESGKARLPVGCFLLPGEPTVLIDAGLGPHLGGTLSGGSLLDELAALGVMPADVDVLAISHLHLDHDGWIATAEQGITFPNATIHVGAGDYEHFVIEEAGAGNLAMAEHLKDAMRILHDDGRIMLLDDTTEIVPGIVALPTPGHTPGHMVYAIRDGGEQLMILGDAMYCPEQLTDMDLAAMHDVDPAAARRTRELIAREVEAHDTQAVGCHFPGLRAARVVGGEALVV